MSDATLPPPQKEYDPSSIPFEHVYFRNHGEPDDLPATKDNKYKSVITDENGNPRKDANGEIMYRLGPHPEDLSGRCLLMPHPETGLATHITIRQLIDDYEKGLSENKVRQAHFNVKYSKDDKKDIMSYNDIVNFLSQDENQYDGQYWA